MARDPGLVKRHLLAMLLLAACTDRRTEPPTSDGGTREPPDTSTRKQSDADTCMPAGLETAKALEIVKLPSGCRWANAGSFDAPARIADAAQLETALTCDAGVARPSFDLSTHALDVVEFSMSPAYGGMAVVDDGAIVTFVQRDRSPCPNDPRPMPMNTTLAYRIEKAATREHRNLACTLPPRCS